MEGIDQGWKNDDIRNVKLQNGWQGVVKGVDVRDGDDLMVPPPSGELR